MKMDELVMAGFARSLQIDLVATQLLKLIAYVGWRESKHVKDC